MTNFLRLYGSGIILTFFSLSFLLIPDVPAFAQAKKVTGVVRNEAGEPLSNVTATVKGTTNATTTDTSGRYSISVPSGRSTLVFSYVGFAPQEVNPGS